MDQSLPSYMRAKTAQGLRLLMLKTNARHGIDFHYFDIQFAAGYWYAWYFLPGYKSINEVSDE